MVIKEMRMHMASPEACFQAATAAECIEQIHRWMHPTSPFCSLLLREAIENLCLDTLSPESQQQFSQLGPLNLFVMVSGLKTPHCPFPLFVHTNLKQQSTTSSFNTKICSLSRAKSCPSETGCEIGSASGKDTQSWHLHNHLMASRKMTILYPKPCGNG